MCREVGVCVCCLGVVLFLYIYYFSDSCPSSGNTVKALIFFFIFIYVLWYKSLFRVLFNPPLYTVRRHCASFAKLFYTAVPSGASSFPHRFH